MKRLNFKWLLLSILLSVAGISQVWANSDHTFSGGWLYFDNNNIKANDGNTVAYWVIDGTSTAYMNIYDGTGTGAGYNCSTASVEYLSGSTYRMVFPTGKCNTWQLVRGPEDCTTSWQNHTYAGDAANFDNGKNYFWCSSGNYYYSWAAYNATLYWDNQTAGWNDSKIELMIGKSGYSNTFELTQITNAPGLYYYTISWYGDYTQYDFIGNSSHWGESKTQSPSDRKGSATHRTNTRVDGLDDEHYLYSYTSGTTNDQALAAPTVMDSYSDFDRTITIREKYNASGTTPWDEVDDETTHGTITASGYKFDSWTTCAGSSSCSITRETSTYSANADFGYTSTVTLTAGATKAGKAFVGWYRSNGTLISSNTSTTITVTGNETVYAYYKDEETHDVTISYMCSSSSIKDGVTESAVGVSTTRSVTAPTIDHYRFSHWTYGSGVTIATGSTTNPTITINSVSGSDLSYTLTANYKRLRRYYFTNVSWSNVYAYMWKQGSDPMKQNAKWPGVEITGKTKADVACGTRYYYELDASVGDSALYDHIIFNEGSGDGKAKTGDLSIEDHEDELFVWTNSGDAKGTWYDLSDHSVAVATEAEYKGTVSGGGTAKAYGCSATITATPQPGYRFSSWSSSNDVTITSTTSSTTTVYAKENVTITANFTQEGIILFDNTMSQWKGDIYVYLFTDGSKDPWWKTQSGKNGPGVVPCEDGYGYLYNKYGQMTRIGESDIYYFDYAALGLSGSDIKHVLFTKGDHHNSNGLYQTSAAYISDFDDNNTYQDFPMYIASKDWSTTNSTGYHNSGYWKRYNVTNSGFDIRGTFNSWTADQYQFTSVTPNSNTFKTTVHLNAGTPQFRIYRRSLSSLGNTGTMTASNHSGWEMTVTSDCKIEIPSGGDYEFTINLGTDHIYLSVEYPLLANDYRLLYTGRITTDGSDSHQHPTQAIRHLTKADTTTYDTVSVFIDAAHKGSLKMQKCVDPSANSGKGSWTDTITGISLTGATTTGIYSFVITQTTTAAGVRTASVAPLAENFKYTGNLYIRTDGADGGWEEYKSVENNKLQYSDYAKTHSGYDYYFCHWMATDKNLHATIANDYSPSISDTITTGESPFMFDALPYQANVRYMYNSATNHITRAYLNGANEGGEAVYLSLRTMSTTSGETHTGDSIKNTDDTYTNITKDGYVSIAKFKDLGNWVYQKDLKVLEGTHARLISDYYYSSTNHYQYFKGSAGDWNPSTTEELIGGTTTNSWQTLRLVYDFKTNHLVAAWMPPSSDVNTAIAINADVMIIREEQKDAKQLTFGASGSLSKVDTVYGVMQFNKWSLNNRNKTNTADSTRSVYARDLYWISFPFDVKLNDVFGFGNYGTHWIIEYYDGKGRAKNGFWADSPSNWKFVYPSMRDTFKLEANVGYILALDLDHMTPSSAVWENVEDVYLYFPSKDKVGNISKTTATVTFNQTGYNCTINRQQPNEAYDVNKNRTIADSYWHCIGVPSFANNSVGVTTDGSTAVTWSTSALPYIYEWGGYSSPSSDDNNTLTPQATSTFAFKAMHAYLVQYSANEMHWSQVSTPSAAIAARLATNPDRNYQLSLMLNNVEEDHALLRLTDDENVTTGFEFNQDLSKEYNNGHSNIWTVTTNGVQVAGNSMPHPLATTIVPVGVKIATTGDYTFSMPEGTNGGDVWLLDNQTNSRTNLGLMDYTVNLTTGTIDGRFSLEFPVQNVVTDMETVDNGQLTVDNDVRKVFVGGRLYIIRDGKAYDATGAQVK